MKYMGFGKNAWVASIAVATVLAVAGLTMAGCTANTTAGSASSVSASAAKTATPILITDAPSDQILSFTLTVNSIVLTDSKGSTASVLSAPVTIDASHLNAVLAPLLSSVNVPQDTYVSATITVANPIVVYVNPTTGAVVSADATLTAATTTVTFASPITVTSTSLPLCFDLLVGQSVTISGSTVTVTPTFGVTQNTFLGQPINGSRFNQNIGNLGGILGTVVSVSGANVVVTLPNGTQITIATNSSTVLQGITSVSALTVGEIIQANVSIQSGGTYLATQLQLLAASGSSVYAGPVTAVTGSPATSFTQLVQQPLGFGATVLATGTTDTVNLTSTTAFEVSTLQGALPTLPFTPIFTAATVFAGQTVLVAAPTASGSTVTAQSVTLVPQTIDGTITAVSTSGSLTTYTLTLPSGSALGTLTGQTSVLVYVDNATQILNSTAIGVGSSVRFVGLLFNNSGTLTIVAGTSCDLAGGNGFGQH